MTNTTKKEIDNILMQAADSSRSSVDASVYKDYVLTILFYKYISDLSNLKRKEYIERYDGNEQRAEEKMKMDRFYIPKEANFDELYKQVESDTLGEKINIALNQIEDSNKEKLKGIFQVDFNSESILGKPEQRNKMINELLKDFNKIDFTEVSADLLGESYMTMIEKFGSEAGKKAGEFFTVSNVAELVAKLAKPEPGDRICDPAVGSGGLLLLAAKEVQNQGSNDYALYGQESTGSTYQLARMNMFLNNEDSARLEWGDTLNNPLLVEEGKLIKYDICVANPPFSLKKWDIQSAEDGSTTRKSESDQYNRFHRGIPPKDKGDYAFISHIIETLKPKTGRAAVIVPHGVLFRSGAEGKIRQAILQENLIDAVIGLPAGLFSTTGIQVAILVIDRSREVGGANEDKKDVLFIEASKEFKPGKKQNTLETEHSAKILEAYDNRQDIDKFARVVSAQEIADNDYNLNITRYVDTFEEEEPVDIQANLKKLEELEPELKELESKMMEYLELLNIKK